MRDTPPGSAKGRDSTAAGRDSTAGRAELSAIVRRQFAAGDVDALGAVYDRYARPVWAVAMKVTQADHLAQEAVQETFIRAWGAASSYDPSRALGPWLLTIARYTALDLLRRELRPTRGAHEAEQDAVVEPPDFDQAWLSWAVQEALHQLAEHEREVVRLSFYEDLTHQQIAERLAVPVGTVKSRSHRAHRRLAELLAHVRDTGSAAAENSSAPGGRSPTTGNSRPGRGGDPAGATASPGTAQRGEGRR